MDDFDPNNLLDHLIGKMAFLNDAELAQALEIQVAPLRKIRRGTKNVDAGLLIRINDATGIGIGDLRSVMRDRRSRTRLSAKDGKQRFSARVMTAWDKLALQRKSESSERDLLDSGEQAAFAKRDFLQDSSNATR